MLKYKKSLIDTVIYLRKNSKEYQYGDNVVFNLVKEIFGNWSNGLACDNSDAHIRFSYVPSVVVRFPWLMQ